MALNFESIRYEIADKVATITLNRPERHNAFTAAMSGELRRAWADVKANPEVVCVIVTAAGDKAFCTGIDVADMADGSAPDEAARIEREEGKPFYMFLTAIQNRCWKPVITAVNGMVVGGGLHFIADSDLIVCAEHATFFDTHVKVGLIAGLEPVGLTRRMPLERCCAWRSSAASERMTAQQALALGLVGEVLPKEQAAAARARARREDRRALTDGAREEQAGDLGEPRRRPAGRHRPHLRA